MEKDNVLAYTPSRQVLGKRIQCHDDRLVLIMITTYISFMNLINLFLILDTS